MIMTGDAPDLVQHECAEDAGEVQLSEVGVEGEGAGALVGNPAGVQAVKQLGDVLDDPAPGEQAREAGDAAGIDEVRAPGVLGEEEVADVEVAVM